jgi:hypothetical protein
VRQGLVATVYEYTVLDYLLDDVTLPLDPSTFKLVEPLNGRGGSSSSSKTKQQTSHSRLLLLLYSRLPRTLDIEWLLLLWLVCPCLTLFILEKSLKNITAADLHLVCRSTTTITDGSLSNPYSIRSSTTRTLPCGPLRWIRPFQSLPSPQYIY